MEERFERDVRHADHEDKGRERAECVDVVGGSELAAADKGGAESEALHELGGDS